MTMLIATHEMAFAKKVADEVIFLDRGVVKEFGSPEQVLGNAQSKELQDFLTSLKSAGRL
jgi:polar amino acid transport system ATP-binding protein